MSKPTCHKRRLEFNPLICLVGHLQRQTGVTINCTGLHRTTPDRTGPHWARTGSEMTDYFTSTTN